MGTCSLTPSLLRLFMFPSPRIYLQPTSACKLFHGSVEPGPNGSWAMAGLSTLLRCHGNPGIPRAGCCVTDVKRDHCSHASKPAGLPEMYLYLYSAAFRSLFPFSFLSQTNSHSGSLFIKARSWLSDAGKYAGGDNLVVPALGTAIAKTHCWQVPVLPPHWPWLRSSYR